MCLLLCWESCFSCYTKSGSTEYHVLVVMLSIILQSVFTLNMVMLCHVFYAERVNECHVFVVMLNVEYWVSCSYTYAEYHFAGCLYAKRGHTVMGLLFCWLSCFLMLCWICQHWASRSYSHAEHLFPECLRGLAERRYAECRFAERRGACAAAALRTSTHFFLLSTFDMTGKFVFQRKKLSTLFI